MGIRKILGLSLAAAIGYAAYFLYTDYNMLVRMLRKTVFDEVIGIGFLRDTQWVVMAVLVFALLWVAEKIWDAAANRLWPEQDH